MPQPIEVHVLTDEELLLPRTIAVGTSGAEAAQTVTVRQLASGDVIPFGTFLENLSATTVRRFRPHPLSRATATTLCAGPATVPALRLIATTDAPPSFVAYFILEFGFDDLEVNRYQDYGIPLDPRTDCRLAPVVADRYQTHGLGSLMMLEILRVARQLERRQVILFGGTQATNSRAIGFYEKFGFIKVGEFLQNGINNHDMVLGLK